MQTNKPEVAAVVVRRFGESQRAAFTDYGWSLPDGEQLIRLTDYEALQAECEKLRAGAIEDVRLRTSALEMLNAANAECERMCAALKRLCNIYIGDDYYSGEERERRLDEAVRRSIDAVGGALEHE